MSVGELRGVPERWMPKGTCVIFACDIASFGDTSRTDDVREIMRHAMYRQLDVSFGAAGIGPERRYHEDRGDGVMVLVPAEVGTEPLLTTVVEMLRAELRRYNKAAADVAQIKLRVSVHTGEARHDGNGVVGTPVNHAFRILDAPPFKDALSESGASLAVIVSQRVHDDVVRHGPGLIDPDEYRRIDIAVKETEGAAWVRVPGAGSLPVPGTGTDVARAVGDVPRVGGGPASAEPDSVPPHAVFTVVDAMCAVSLMATEQGRNQVMRIVRGEIAGAVPRHAEARMDVYSIVTTCLDYPGGLRELLVAVRGLAGESMAVMELEQTVARVLPRL
ncbi:effector-associated domain 2-containing protein [Actinomadura algeriensis]|uniref:Effector-associated domain-containing protein n=1 Tax=Actinomadura algeriensis TaxID=1679523 RepID=A0ABR9JUU2_9ACTN|nr:hypothetical protein [Actinomadura algeriensis]MBE1534347.1 hypothetical protein [Actinomadura algeriensis]